VARTGAGWDGVGGAFGKQAGGLVDGEDTEEVGAQVWDHDEGTGGVEDHFVLVGGVLARGHGPRLGELVLEGLQCLETARGQNAPGGHGGCVTANC